MNASESVLPEIFVVDDDPGVLSALGRLLRTVGYRVNSFESAHVFLTNYNPATPGCAVLDVRMSEIDGLALQLEMAARGDLRPIIFLTSCDDAATSVKAMKAGAIDYLVKPVNDTDLLSAVESALRADEEARRRNLNRDALRQQYGQLTPRERQVMDHVVQGCLNKQIAYELGIVEKTVKVHRARVMEKMGVRSIAALVRVWQELHVSDRPGRKNQLPDVLVEGPIAFWQTGRNDTA